MNRAITLTRRTLLKGSAALGAGLVIGFRLPLDAAPDGSNTSVSNPSGPCRPKVVSTTGDGDPPASWRMSA